MTVQSHTLTHILTLTTWPDPETETLYRSLLHWPWRTAGLPVAAKQVQSVGVDYVLELGVGYTLRAPPRRCSRLGHWEFCNGKETKQRWQEVVSVEIAADGGGEQTGDGRHGVHGPLLWRLFVCFGNLAVYRRRCAVGNYSRAGRARWGDAVRALRTTGVTSSARRHLNITEPNGDVGARERTGACAWACVHLSAVHAANICLVKEIDLKGKEQTL